MCSLMLLFYSLSEGLVFVISPRSRQPFCPKAKAPKSKAFLEDIPLPVPWKFPARSLLLLKQLISLWHCPHNCFLIFNLNLLPSNKKPRLVFPFLDLEKYLQSVYVLSHYFNCPKISGSFWTVHGVCFISLKYVCITNIEVFPGVFQLPWYNS